MPSLCSNYAIYKTLCSRQEKSSIKWKPCCCQKSILRSRRNLTYKDTLSARKWGEKYWLASGAYAATWYIQTLTPIFRDLYPSVDRDNRIRFRNDIQHSFLPKTLGFIPRTQLTGPSFLWQNNWIRSTVQLNHRFDHIIYDFRLSHYVRFDVYGRFGMLPPLPTSSLGWIPKQVLQGIGPQIHSFVTWESCWVQRMILKLFI